MSDTTDEMTLPSDINALSLEQLEELLDELADSDPLRIVVTSVLEQRRRKEHRKQNRTTTTTSGGSGTTRTAKGRKLRAGEPGDRAIRAAATFNAEPVKVEVWRAALAEATDPATGEVTLTPRIVQLGINAYFAQRKIDANSAKSVAVPAPTPAPTDENKQTEVDEVTEIAMFAAIEAIVSDGESVWPVGTFSDGLPSVTDDDDDLLEDVIEQREFVAIQPVDFTPPSVFEDSEGVWDDR
jgi:hypothetical protein